VFGIFRGLIKMGLLGGVLVIGGGGYGYYRYAAAKLPDASGGAVVYSATPCRATASLSGAGPIPVTFEALSKSVKAHNWLDGGRAGLVSARYEWSHGSQAWVKDAAFEERQRAAVAERKKIAGQGIEELLKELGSADAARREIAAKELLIRTGETQGYRYDAPEAERAQAIENWQRWWADDRNKMKAGAKRALDGAQKVLDTLKRALGEPEPTPPPAAEPEDGREPQEGAR
jgi:hypothetical protein